MDTLRYQRPQMSMPGDNYAPPSHQVGDNFGGGGEGGGFPGYLMQRGWNGQGPAWQAAFQMRQQGMHPRWDMNHPGQAYRGLGQLAGPQQPVLANESGYQPQGLGMLMASRRMTPMVTR